MKIIEVKDRTTTLINQLVEVWEDSVKATHLFLSDEEIKNIKKYVPQAISGVKNLKEGIHISKIMKDIDITSPRFIISIRMAIGVSIAILIGTLLGLQRTMWISMSVMSLTQLEFETTKERFKHRIVYTLIGAVAFVLLFQVLIPEKYNGLASIILSYIYTFIKDYKHQIIFITVNALSASMLIFDPTEAIGTRILLIISGCMLAMVINKIDLKKPMIAIKERLAKPDIA